MTRRLIRIAILVFAIASIAMGATASIALADSIGPGVTAPTDAWPS